ncbi:hypothetical protein S245_035953, partial [Arachis hypogaea]
ANFRYTRKIELRFGADVMEVVVSWTKALCVDISQGRIPNHVDDVKAEGSELGNKVLSGWSVLDIGTGNGLLLQELAKQGYGTLISTWKFCLLGVCGCDRFENGSIADVLKTIVKKDGYRGLMRGWIPRMLFHAPAAAICWSTYEAGKSFFQELNQTLIKNITKSQISDKGIEESI